MKIILCGYHWTGCKALELLVSAGHQVFVYTHTAQNSVPDLEALCNKYHVEYTKDKISVDNLPFVPDVICSIYYRFIIGKDIIDLVEGKIFNLHPALLPYYRGCSSLTWAMINGERECGFTYHYIDEGCDTGNIIIQKKIKIENFDTQLTLYNRVMFESMDYFMEALQLVVDGYAGEKQQGEGYKYTLAIVGCGGHGRSVLQSIDKISRGLPHIVFIDENAKKGEMIGDFPVLREYPLSNKDRYFVAIGDNIRREKISTNYKKNSCAKCVTVLSASSHIADNAQIAEGCFVGEKVYVGPDAKIDEGCIINTGAIIEHEVVIGKFSHIAPNTTVCGRTHIGSNVMCGAGSVIKDYINICDNVIIGAGSVVIRDITEEGTYVGNPVTKVGEGKT